MIFRVLDYETTGFAEDEKAEVIEIGTTDLVADDENESDDLGRSWQTFVKPTGPIPPETRAVHHITDAEVADARTFQDLSGGIFDGLEPDDILVAHNADFEKHFTPASDHRWIDTYKVALVAWPDAPGHSNQV